MIFLHIVIEAFLLLILLSIFAKERSWETDKIIIVVVGITIVNFIMGGLLWTSIGYFVLVPMILVYLLAIGRYFGLSFIKSLIITSLIFIIRWGLLPLIL